MLEPTLTVDMMVVLGLLGLAIVLFVTEVVRIDVAALLVLVLIGLVPLVPGLDPLVAPGELFAGFASNAVVSIMAVMVLGAGLDRAGVMQKAAAAVLRVGGTTEARVIATVSGTVGVISSFMQNIGAAALFLPVVRRVAERTGRPLSRLLMPMGFAAIVGGTITMVGSSPLILLNDLMPEDLEPFALFDVAPVGLALLVATILYFVLLGRFVLPAHTATAGSSAQAEALRPAEAAPSGKTPQALGFLALSLALILFTDLSLSLALMAGALGMVLTGVIGMDEAYRAISWKTVFLLAGLIPLGLAVETTGTAAWIATTTLDLLGTVPSWVLQAVFFALTTFFTLVMSNVGATVLLVPLAVNIALAAQGMGVDADPRVFAMIVGIATSNAFVLPTHQVNALLMDEGGYRVKDFVRAGGGMTVLYAIVALVAINLVF
ncbi:MAG: SLC13 family permease [Rubricoccaceae bacterium]